MGGGKGCTQYNHRYGCCRQRAREKRVHIVEGGRGKGVDWSCLVQVVYIAGFEPLSFVGWCERDSWLPSPGTREGRRAERLPCVAVALGRSSESVNWTNYCNYWKFQRPERTRKRERERERENQLGTESRGYAWSVIWMVRFERGSEKER